jgi:hypothetical protein
VEELASRPLAAALATPLLSMALGLLVLRHYYAALAAAVAAVAVSVASRSLGRLLLPGRRLGAGGS